MPMSADRPTPTRPNDMEATEKVPAGPTGAEREMRGGAVEIVVSERFAVGESPVWDAEQQQLLWCDIPAGAIHGLDIATGKRSRWSFGEAVPSFGLAQAGRFVVALKND